MADDGLLLNFDISPDAIIKPKIKPTGGTWRERRKVVKAQKGFTPRTGPNSDFAGGAGKAIEEFNVGKGYGEKDGGREAAPHRVSRPGEKSHFGKRKRDGEVVVGGGAGGKQAGKTKEKGAQTGEKDRQVISSLFTYNPEPESKPTTETAEAVDDAPKEPTNAPDASSSFTTLGLSPILASHLVTKLGLEHPTAIQKTAIPQLISEDSDAFIQAETGSGKTLTYLLPIMNRIMSLNASGPGNLHRDSGLFAIILAPTRELARQIMSVLSTLIHAKNGPHWIVPTCITGGEKRKAEKARLRKGVNVLIATPGRLLDHLENTQSFDVSRVRWLVLDEGDRLMELGFEESLKKILNLIEGRSELTRHKADPNTNLPKRRITMLCSATMKTNVQRLGDMSLKEALYIKAEKDDSEGKDKEKVRDSEFHAPAQLKQTYSIVPQKLRLVTLNAVLKRAFIRKSANPKVIVFFSCSDSVDFHFDVFARQQKAEGDEKSGSDSDSDSEDKAKSASGKASSSTSKPETPAVAASPSLHPTLLLHKLHGSLAQPIRTSTLHSFTKTKTPALLFCTDVAARGLDLPNVDLVVQFDPPFDKADYLHRIGRTARAGREGRALLFLLPGNEEKYVNVVGGNGNSLVPQTNEEILKRGFGPSFQDEATEWQLSVERWVLENPIAMERARKAWGSHIRAYTTHKGDEKSIFNHRELHYGHLAKSFGLRERPGDIKVPETGMGKGEKRDAVSRAIEKAEKNAGKKGAKRALEDVGEVKESDAKERMRKMAKIMEGKFGLRSEFNVA